MIICVKLTDKENIENIGLNNASTRAWRLDPERANQARALVSFVDNKVAQVFFGGRWVKPNYVGEDEIRYEYVDYKVATISDINDLGISYILTKDSNEIFTSTGNPVAYVIEV